MGQRWILRLKFWGQWLGAFLLGGIASLLGTLLVQDPLLARRWPSFNAGLPDDWQGCNPAPYGCWAWWTESLNCFPMFCLALTMLLLLPKHKYTGSLGGVFWVVAATFYDHWRKQLPINPEMLNGPGWIESTQVVALKYYAATLLFPLLGWGFAVVGYGIVRAMKQAIRK